MIRASSAMLVFVLVVAAPSTLRAAELVAGIYQVVSDGEGTPVARTSGGTINLGHPISANFTDASIWSTSNQNDRFGVLINVNGPIDERTPKAIYADGVCEVLNAYSQPDAPGKFFISGDIVGHENALKLTSWLKPKVQLRKHPGHQLRVTWKPLRESYKIGAPVSLELEIENIGTYPVRFVDGGNYRGGRDNQFGFAAIGGFGQGRSVPDIGSGMHMGGLSVDRDLAPGETFRKQVDLSKWFKFDKADTYEITGFYSLELKDPAAPHAGFLPALWEGFATGRFLLRVEE